MGIWTPYDDDVFSDTPSSAWKELNLSSIVGSNVALCLFGVSDNWGAQRCSFRPKGSTLTPDHIDSSTHGKGYSALTPNKWKTFSCVTDSSGIVEHAQSHGFGTLTIRLLGFCKLSYSGPTVLETDYVFNTVNWSSYGIDGEIGENQALAILSYKFVSGGIGVLGVRTPGDSRDVEYTVDGTRGGCNRGVIAASGKNGIFIAVATDENGDLEHGQPSGTALHAGIILEGAEIDNFFDVRQQVKDDILAEDDWQNLDLSAYVTTRALCSLLVENGDTGSQVVDISCRRKGETRDFSFNAGESGHGAGVHTCSSAVSRAGHLLVECDDDGIVDLYSYYGGTPNSTIRLTLLWYLPSNEPPTISGGYPTGSSEERDVEIGFSCQDDSQVDSNEINVSFSGQGYFDAIVDGVFQNGFGGSITANASNGYDVVIDTHPDLAAGVWTVDVSVKDEDGAEGIDSWEFTTVWKPILQSVIPIGRRTIELTFDIPVIVREITQDLLTPVDRYTPVDWTGNGGNSFDGANVDNYEISRPIEANLSSPGEAADIDVILAAEYEYVRTEEGIYYVSPVIQLTIDYQQTARAGYRINVQNLKHSSGTVMDETEINFFGFIVSSVQRNSFTLIENLPEIVRQWDNDGTGDLAKFFTAHQEVFNRLLEDIDAFFLETCDIDKMQEGFLNLALYDLGNPFFDDFPTLTVNQKRKLLAVLVDMYKQKGTCQGLINAVLFFTGVQLTGCKEPWDLTWILEDPVRGLLGTSTYLGPSTDHDRYSFWVQSPVILTAEQIRQITAIAEWSKPAHTHLLGIIQPDVGVSDEFWSIGISRLGSDTRLLT